MLIPHFQKRAKPMLRKPAAHLICAAILFASLTSCSQEPAVPAPERIILIVVDTLRKDHVSAYAPDPNGGANTKATKANTPNIDRIADGGQVFTNAVASFHATTMSMAALFTGLTPSIESSNDSDTVKWNTFVACGLARFLEDGTDDACIPNSVETVAEDLKNAGYWTVGVVSNGLLYRPSGYDRGFDSWVEVGLAKPGQNLNIFQASPIRTATHVNSEVKAALAKRPSDRFFLYVHYLDVHDYSLFKRDYAANVERFDRHLGTLLDHLEEEGLLEDATIILTSDHGEMLGEINPNTETARHFGNPALQPVLEIPLIIKPKTNLASDTFFRSQDVRGLIRGLVGLSSPVSTELRSDELFLSEMFFRSLRQGRWKSHWPRTGDAPFLFDLLSDPRELVNLAASPTDEQAVILEAHRKRIGELSKKLATHTSQVPPLDDNDVMRLRALGYIETTDESFGKSPSAESKPGAKPN